MDAFLGGCWGVVAVSYTHLDVYKRQVVTFKIKHQTLAAQKVDELGLYMPTVLCTQEQRQRYATGYRSRGIADVEEAVCGVCAGANLKARAIRGAKLYRKDKRAQAAQVGTIYLYICGICAKTSAKDVKPACRVERAAGKACASAALYSVDGDRCVEAKGKCLYKVLRTCGSISDFRPRRDLSLIHI